MMRIVYVICAIVESGTCEERVLDFNPVVPLACIHAAAPELDQAVPEGWTLDRWRCADDETELRIAVDD